MTALAVRRHVPARILRAVVAATAIGAAAGCAAPLYRDGKATSRLEQQSDWCRARSVPSVGNAPAATSYDRCMDRFSGTVNGRN